MKDTVALGTVAKGAHSFVWNGKTTGGQVVADGTYSIVLSTTATVSGRKLVGRATKNVVVDLTAPKLTAVTGDGTTIFPSGGGSPASLTSKVTLDEPGAITLTLRNSGGTLVRTLIASGIAGKTPMTWNGANTAGALVPSGTYTLAAEGDRRGRQLAQRGPVHRQGAAVREAQHDAGAQRQPAVRGRRPHVRVVQPRLRIPDRDVVDQRV